ncbi:hypothetical protein D3C75_782720 [compost metagenome]
MRMLDIDVVVAHCSGGAAGNAQLHEPVLHLGGEQAVPQYGHAIIAFGQLDIVCRQHVFNQLYLPAQFAGQLLENLSFVITDFKCDQLQSASLLSKWGECSRQTISKQSLYRQDRRISNIGFSRYNN